MVYNREGHNEKKTEEIFYSIKYYYMDMPAVTVSTRKSAKVKQSRYTPVSDLPSALAIRTDSDDYRLGQVSDRIGLQAGPCRIES